VSKSFKAFNTGTFQIIFLALKFYLNCALTYLNTISFFHDGWKNDGNGSDICPVANFIAEDVETFVAFIKVPFHEDVWWLKNFYIVYYLP
jgi:hypothetical protein